MLRVRDPRGTTRASTRGIPQECTQPMLIRSTANACLVILRSGLTLEISFDQNTRDFAFEDNDADETRVRRAPAPSQGVWIFREEVLFEVTAGQA
jgi:hypothetical protein